MIWIEVWNFKVPKFVVPADLFWKTTPEGQMDGHEHRGLVNPHSQRGHLY